MAAPGEQLVFRDGVPTDTSDPFAAFRGPVGSVGVAPVEGTGAAGDPPASDAADEASDPANGGVDASPVSGPTQDEDQDQGLGSVTASAPARAIGIILLVAAALMAAAAVWWSGRTEG